MMRSETIWNRDEYAACENVPRASPASAATVQTGGAISTSRPTAMPSAVAAEPIIWLIASATADSSMSESPSPIGSSRPIITAASVAESCGVSTNRLPPSTPDT